MTSSHHTEGKATLAGSDVLLRARQVRICFGCPVQGPSMIGTDSLSNFQVAMGMATPGRIKHIMRQWQIVQERVKAADIQLLRIGDADMPADFLTKWLPKKKLLASLARATNATNAVPLSSDNAT